MKKIVKCGVPDCGKFYRQSRMYKVKLRDWHSIPGAYPYVDEPEREVLICPECNKRAGYKGRKEKI